MGKLLTSHRYNRLILAAFRPWGDSAGAGRVRLTRHKSTLFSLFSKKECAFIIVRVISKGDFKLYQPH